MPGPASMCREPMLGVLITAAMVQHGNETVPDGKAVARATPKELSFQAAGCSL